MGKNRIICKCKNVDYLQIRRLMVDGVRNLEEVMERTGAGTGCGGCISEIEEILASVCGCHNVSLESVVKAVRAGDDTVDKVKKSTGAGTACGRCEALAQNIIDLKR